jgi:uncharacterized protein
MTQDALNAQQVADYLREHRDFLLLNADVMIALEMPHTEGENTVSLQARQVKQLREHIDMHEAQLDVLLDNARNSESIAKAMHTLTLSMLAQRSVSDLPLAGQEAMGHVFKLQDTAFRLWGTESIYDALECNQAVDEDVKTFADSLKQPYCGAVRDFTALQWLQRDVGSVAMMALRVTPNANAFGLMVVGSQDPLHFTPDKATDFLAQLAQVFSASLGRMLPPYS